MKKKIITKKRIIIISIIMVPILMFALILALWNGFTPIIGRGGIERRLYRALTVDYEFVSSERIKNSSTGRAERHYAYKDANGIEFTVKSYKYRVCLPYSNREFWWSNRVECNYIQMFMAQNEYYIMDYFGDCVEARLDGYDEVDYWINVYNYEQLVETTDIIAEMYAEIPPFPIKKDAFHKSFSNMYGGQSHMQSLKVGLCLGDCFHALGNFDFPCEGEDIPKSEYFLKEMERTLAAIIRLDHINQNSIDIDTLPQRVLDMINNEE